MINLSEQQRSIVELCTGRHVVFAPPGTGKTELLSQRVNRALSAGLDPREMVCLTFTNRAARNMTERIQMRAKADQLFVGNFHSFAMQFLFANRLVPQSSSLLDEEDAHELMREAMDVVRDGDPITARPYLDRNSDQLKTEVLMLCNNLLNQKQLSLDSEIVDASRRLLYEGYQGVWPSLKDSQTKSVFRLICTAYEQMKQESLALDYDDLLNLTVYHLGLDQSLKMSGYRWLQADEIQDLNTIQWHIIRLIQSDQAHVVLFGDHEQSIFSFMGANHSVLESTISYYTHHFLNTNYRSPAHLLRMFNSYACEHLRPKWNETPVSEVQSRDRRVSMYSIEYDGTREEEAEYICGKVIPHLLSHDDRPMAVLTRTNSTADVFSGLLDQCGISHFKVSGFDLFRRKTIKDIMACLSVFENPDCRTPWARIFLLFSGVRNLKESRRLVNSIFSAGFRPADFMTSEGPDHDTTLDRFAHEMQNGRLVVFDTETTGLDTSKVDIVQIAAVEIVRGEIGQEFNCYLKTQQDLRDTLPIHQISGEFLDQYGRPPDEVFDDFFRFVGTSPLVAHNLSYDWAVLRAHTARVTPRRVPTAEHPRFDTLDIARRLLPDAKDYKLANLIGQLGIDGQNTHNALDDVRATARLAMRLATLASESSAERQGLIHRNKAIIRHLVENFAPVWAEVHERLNSDTSLVQLIIRLCELRQLRAEKDDGIHLEKLKRHMALKCASTTLRDQLRLDYPIYRHYKESDLILGDEHVVVATVHKAKGLEWNTVIIPECNENVYPSFYSVRKAEGEPDVKNRQEILCEEARILYVALTRARRRVLLSWHNRFVSQYGKPYSRQPSRFIKVVLPYYRRYDSAIDPSG